MLTTPSLDLAVAWGAAAYAWLRHTGGKRIGGGIARGYYVGVDAVQNPPAADGTIPVLCVVPRHLAEEEEIVLAQPELDLTLGAPVLFSLFTSTVRDDKAGDVLHVKPSQLLALPPLTTIMRGGKRAGGGLKHVPVSLAVRSTAVGTLEIHCVAKDGGMRWRLEFNTREIVRPAESGDDGESDSADRTQLIEMIPEAVVQSATAAIEGTFAAVPSDPTPQDVTRALESAHGNAPRGLADRRVPPAGRQTRGSGRGPQPLARPSIPLVQFARLYAPPGIRRPAGSVPGRSVVEASPRGETRARRRRRWKQAPMCGSCGAAWLAACRLPCSRRSSIAPGRSCCRGRAKPPSSPAPMNWPRCGEPQRRSSGSIRNSRSNSAMC